MELSVPSRRQFLTAIGNLASAGWIATNWPQIAAAAEHAGHAADDSMPPVAITTLSQSDAATAS